MTQLMQGHAEHVVVGADVPAFGIVEVHVPGDRLGIGRRGIKRMRQNAAGTIKGITVAVGVRWRRRCSRFAARWNWCPATQVI